MSIIAYLQFCPPGSLFFDRPEFDGGRFELSDAAVPEGWQRHTDTEWVHVLSPHPLPGQGWKIHVSATSDSAEEVLATCWDYCCANGLSFKFLRSLQVLTLRSSKYAERSGSGKFVTIYPRSDEELNTVLTELDPLVSGSEGPSILSDVRYRQGPLYLRYGAFQVRYLTDAAGRKVLAIEGPDGDLVPDERKPGFHVPDWVEIPPVVSAAIEERNKGRLIDFPYRPTKALHFSNGGGVYLGVDAQGSTVLLKEARPFAGLDGGGDDAVTRLEREAWAYRVLDHLPQVPGLDDYRLGHAHYFLVREYVEGEPLAGVMRQRNPLLKPGSTPEEYAEYAEWALALLANIREVVEKMHEVGVLFGDLHPSNILLTADGEICFIDLEGAHPIDSDEPQLLGAPGYIAPTTFRGAAIDEYAWAVMNIDIFVPSARLVSWRPEKATELIDFAMSRFPLPESYRESVRSGLREDMPRFDETTGAALPLALQNDLDRSHWPGSDVDNGDALAEADDNVDWQELVRELAEGIIAMATPDRDDRLYPGDAQSFQHDHGGVGFVNGAAGVLWCLKACGIPIPHDHREWLVRAADQRTWSEPGFGHGLSGVALTLAVLGDHEAARRSMRQALDMRPEKMDDSFLDGRAGVGLAALNIAAEADDPELILLAAALGRTVIAVLGLDAGTADSEVWQAREPGLLKGGAGAALFLCRLFEATGDRHFLDMGVRALEWDIDVLRQQATALIGPDVDIATWMPLIAGGSGGISLVADRLLRHVDHSGLSEFRDRTAAALKIPFLEEPNVHWGHAGLMLLLRLLTPGGTASDFTVDSGWTPDFVRRAMVAHARTMGLHSVGFRGKPAVTGRFGLRISSDFATGAAGVMLAVWAIDEEGKFPLL